jgi:excisionase family DNA binding protein
MEIDAQSPFMTISEVMEVLRCSRGTVRNLIKDGKLRVIYIRPHCPRILREDVLRLAKTETIDA